MFRVYWENLKKMVVAPIFPLTIIIGVIIYLTGTVYTDDIGSSYSVFSIIFSEDGQKITELIEKTSYELIIGDDKSYMRMFATILTALPYISIICVRNLDNSIRFELIRSSRRKYSMGLILSILTVAGLVMTISYAIYSVILYLIMPDVIFDGQMKSMIIKKMAGIFLYGVANVYGAVGLSAFVRNKYLVACIPFMAKYLICMEIGQLSIDFALAGKYKLIQYINYIVPESVCNVFISGQETQDVVMMLGTLATLVLISYIAYRVSMEKRWDCGA